MAPITTLLQGGVTVSTEMSKLVGNVCELREVVEEEPGLSSPSSRQLRPASVTEVAVREAGRSPKVDSCEPLLVSSPGRASFGGPRKSVRMQKRAPPADTALSSSCRSLPALAVSSDIGSADAVVTSAGGDAGRVPRRACTRKVRANQPAATRGTNPEGADRHVEEGAIAVQAMRAAATGLLALPAWQSRADAEVAEPVDAACTVTRGCVDIPTGWRDANVRGQLSQFERDAPWIVSHGKGSVLKGSVFGGHLVRSLRVRG